MTYLQGYAAKTVPTVDSYIWEFRLGGHKAAAIGMVEEMADIYLVSEMSDDTVKSIFMTPFESMEAAYREALKKHSGHAKVIAMPFGGATLPVVSE